MTRYIETELITENNDHPRGSLVSLDHFGTLDFTVEETDNIISVSLTNGPLIIPTEDIPSALTVAPNQPRQVKMRVVFQERIVATGLTRAQVNDFLKHYYKWISDPSPKSMIFDANALAKGYKASSKSKVSHDKPTPIKSSVVEEEG